MERGRKGRDMDRERMMVPGSERMKRYTKFSKHMRCRFCREKIVVDYKDVATLIKLCSPQGKILARRKTGNCAKHQRSVSGAIKRARFMALLPYVTTGIV